MILAANAELALPASVELAGHLNDTITLTVANVTPPEQHVTQLRTIQNDGPYKVLQCSEKTFILNVNGGQETVSIDCLKPIFLMQHQS